MGTAPEPGWLRTDPELVRRRWRHGWSTVAGPDFRSPPATTDHAAAMARLAASVGLPEVAWAEQVHGGTVLRVNGPGPAGPADALWTDRPGLGVAGRGADCPLLLVGGDRGDGSRLWGFAHASWRATVRGISAALLSALLDAGARPDSLHGVICPSAGPCCYEVGQEVLAAARTRRGPAAESWFRRYGKRWVLDLWRANRDQWTSLGLAPAALAVTGICTICGDGTFPSHRREGAGAGRLGAIIGHPAEPDPGQ